MLHEVSTVLEYPQAIASGTGSSTRQCTCDNSSPFGTSVRAATRKRFIEIPRRSHEQAGAVPVTVLETCQVLHDAERTSNPIECILCISKDQVISQGPLWIRDGLNIRDRVDVRVRFEEDFLLDILRPRACTAVHRDGRSRPKISWGGTACGDLLVRCRLIFLKDTPVCPLATSRMLLVDFGSEGEQGSTTKMARRCVMPHGYCRNVGSKGWVMMEK